MSERTVKNSEREDPDCAELYCEIQEDREDAEVIRKVLEDLKAGRESTISLKEFRKAIGL